MNKNYFTKFILALALTGLIWPSAALAQFTAINDYASGPGTSPNATTYNNEPTQEDGTSGPLKDVNTGVTLSGINMSVTVITDDIRKLRVDPNGINPVAGTPMDIEFSSTVDFSQSALPNNLSIRGEDVFVIHTITGLNPNNPYVLIGGTIVGNQLANDRWSLFELSGADSFTANHSGGLTTAQVGTIAANQVAINTGNNGADGHVFRFEAINPGADGTIVLRTTQYKGAVPGGSADGRVGYAPAAIKLIEAIDAAPTIINQPANVASMVGNTATFTVGASGFPLNYQWKKNGVDIPGATGSSYTIQNVSVTDSGTYSVEVFNNLGSVTSDTALLSVASGPVILVDWNDTWRYEVSATDLGDGWKDPDFVDTSWNAGPGPLGFETSPANLPAVANWNGGTRFTTHSMLTYYFRTTFFFDGVPTDVELRVTNMLDDAAVFYLNGVEVLRPGMAAGPVDFNTPANRTVGDAGLETEFPEVAQLRPGLNVLAVESHQINTTSSDLVMGTQWTAIFKDPTPLFISKQPQSIVVEELKEAVFNVEVNGNGGRFQWFKNGIIIPGATLNVLRIPSVDFGDSGDYTVQIRNTFSSLISVPATLTVLADTNGPTLLTADGSRNFTNILVSFSEKISQTDAEDVNNFRLTTTTGGDFIVFGAVLTNATNVLLTTEARTEDNNYLVVVNNVRDLAPMANAVATDSQVPVSSLLRLIRPTQFWAFYDPFVEEPPPYGDPRFPGTGWEQPGFDDSFWGMGNALFHSDLSNQEYPVARGFQIFPGAITKYFRTTFDFNASPLAATFRMRHVVDDGAIFYLNGVEFHRFNMAETGVDEFSPAAGAIGIASFVDVEDIPTDLLRVGENTIAVELHGMSDTDQDFTFALEFNVAINSLANGPVIITKEPQDLTVIEGNPAVFSFDGAGPRFFQWFENGSPIQGATNATYTIPFTLLSMSGNNYSVIASNDTDNASSQMASLTVIADTAGPRLLSATTDAALSSVLVSFDEPIALNTGQVPGNYAITNETGSINVLSATVVNETNVVLNTGPSALIGAVVVVNGITDRSTGANPILANSAAVIGFVGELVAMEEDPWRVNQEGRIDLGTEWVDIGYNDSSWLEAPGVFSNLTGEQLLNNLTVSTMIRYDAPGANYIFTTYFRKTFNLSAPLPGSVNVVSSNLVDDGAVFYLNENEVARIGMPAGAITFTTQATRGGEVSGRPFDVFSIPGTEFRQGDNVFAVEVHQTSPTSSDVVFGSSLFLEIESQVIPPPVVPDECPDLTIEFVGGNVVITWDSAGNCILQQANTLAPNPANTVWTTVSGATSPYSVSPAGARYYRLRSQ